MGVSSAETTAVNRGGFRIDVQVHDVLTNRPKRPGLLPRAEPPTLPDQPHFQHSGDGISTFITREDWPRVDALVDWLIEKNLSGYKMANFVYRLNEMKAFMRGNVQEWNCRTGHHSIIIRTDGLWRPASRCT